jgi:hypothetical protein
VKSVLGATPLAVELFRITIELVIVKLGAQLAFCPAFRAHVWLSMPIPFVLIEYLERVGLNE